MCDVGCLKLDLVSRKRSLWKDDISCFKSNNDGLFHLKLSFKIYIYVEERKSRNI